jgi:YidC/Oxa1 family membrane protein insertase
MHDLMAYRKTAGMTLGKMIIPLLQAPFFFSVFWGIRSMCYYPVNSLITGGFLWFPDLTIADPFFILPIVATSTVLLMVHVSQNENL